MSLDAVLVLADDVLGNITSAVTASANLAMRGIRLEPGDVDVMTTADGPCPIAAQVADRLGQPIWPAEKTAGEHIRSHYGALALGGTQVELMGDVEHLVEGEWVPTDDVAARREFIEVGSREMPAMLLGHALREYPESRREGPAPPVEAHLL